MGMYSEIVMKDLTIKEELKDLKNGGNSLYNFLNEFCEIKFYGYWNKNYLEFLDEVGTKGLVKGTCIVRYEDPSEPLIMCRWNEKGFSYKFAKTTYPDEWTNIRGEQKLDFEEPSKESLMAEKINDEKNNNDCSCVLNEEKYEGCEE